MIISKVIKNRRKLPIIKVHDKYKTKMNVGQNPTCQNPILPHVYNIINL